MSRKCGNCGNVVQDGDAFCGECGAAMAPAGAGLSCPGCGALVAEGDSFCPGCGKPLGPAPAPAPSFLKVSKGKNCTGCEHFRPAQPVSQRLPKFRNATAVAQAFLKIEEEEQKLRASEAKHKANQISTSQSEWGFQPQMSDYCAAHAADNRYEICELKNRASDCSDYQDRTSTPVQCGNCSFCEPGKRDPYPAPFGNPELYAKRCEAVDAEIALEIQSLFWSKGKPGRQVVVHDMCVLHDRAIPYVNTHYDCQAWKAKTAGPSHLFDAVRKKTGGQS